MLMKQKNLFDGDSYRAEFARISYKLLMTREWVTFEEIMSERLNKATKELPSNLSNCDGYGELKKAFCEIRNAIVAKLGANSFEEKGNNRNKQFRYIGNEKDPLSDILNAKVISDLSQYWDFCQDSAGFFPMSWLEYFFKDCKDLIDIKAKKQRGQQVVKTSIDRILTNIDLLPRLYEAIVNRQVLEIDYKPYNEETTTLLFHPHYLKEYNGRWFLFGHADGKLPEYGYNIALDRIQHKYREKYKIEYISAPKNFYDDFFKEIVGVTRLKDEIIEHIIVRIHDNYIFKLLDTKPIHETHKVILPFDTHEDGQYGEISLDLRINNEFIGRILQMGPGLEIMSPPRVRAIVKQRVCDMASRYI